MTQIGGNIIPPSYAGATPTVNTSTVSAQAKQLGLGTSAFMNVGTTTGTVAAGDDSRFGAMAALLSATNNNSFAVNVKVFGAVGDGVSDDTTFIQNALNSSSNGCVVFPPGIYMISAPLLVWSNTLIFGAGTASIIRPNTAYTSTVPSCSPIFVNRNYGLYAWGVAFADTNITVRDLSFDYVNFPEVGGTHAIHFVNVDGAKVLYCNFTYGNNGTAFIACNDVLTQGCRATNYTNAAYDHWAGTSNVRVLGNYAKPITASYSVPGVQFNCGDGTRTDTRTMTNIIVDDNEIYGAISFDTYGTNCILQDVVITNNKIDNMYGLYCRGPAFFVTIAHNILRNINNGLGAIALINGTGFGYTGSPDHITVENNHIIAPIVTGGGTGVIRLEGINDIVANNTVTAGTYLYALMNIDGCKVLANNFAAGTADYIAVNYWTGYGDIYTVTNEGLFGWQDTTGALVRFVLQNDNNLVLYGTEVGGGQRPIFAVYQQSSTSLFTMSIPMQFNGAAYFSTYGSYTANNGAMSFIDTTGEANVRINLDGSNAFNMYSSNTDGSSRSIMSIQARNSTSLLNFNAPVSMTAAVYFSSFAAYFAATGGIRFIDSSGQANTQFLLDNTDTLRLYATNSDGSQRPVMSLQTRNSTSPLDVYTPIVSNSTIAATLFESSTAVGLTATGTNQTGALLLTAAMNRVTTTPTSSGVILPAGVYGVRYTIFNYGANTLNVYPPVGAQFGNGTVNAPLTLTAGSNASYMLLTSTQAEAVTTSAGSSTPQYTLTSVGVTTGGSTVYPTTASLPAFAEGQRVTISAVIHKVGSDNISIGIVNGSGVGYSINWQSDNNFVLYQNSSGSNAPIHASGTSAISTPSGYFTLTLDIIPDATDGNMLLPGIYGIYGLGIQTNGGLTLSTGTWNAFASSSAGFAKIQSFAVSFGAAVV